MRATAILLVVFSHCIWFFPSLDGVPFTVLNYAGLFGVEIFFVLSGFLIGKILYRIYVLEEFSNNSMIKFWKRRWLRTLPNYYLILVVNIGLGAFYYNDLPNDFWRYFLFIQNFSFEQSSFFYESWSLSIEEFAYILGPLILISITLIFKKYSKKSLFLFMISFVILIFVGTKVYYNYTHENDSMLIWTTNLKSVVIYRIDAIYFGMLAAYISINYYKLWNKHKVLFLILGLFIFISFNMFVSLDKGDNMLIWNVIFLPINTISIGLSLPFLSNFHLNKGVFFRTITYISLLSYAIYLTHYSLVLKLFQRHISNEMSFSNKLMSILVYLIITFLISFILFLYYERPLMNWKQDRS